MSGEGSVTAGLSPCALCCSVSSRRWWLARGGTDGSCAISSQLFPGGWSFHFPASSSRNDVSWVLEPSPIFQLGAEHPPDDGFASLWTFLQCCVGSL